MPAKLAAKPMSPSRTGAGHQDRPPSNFCNSTFTALSCSSCRRASGDSSLTGTFWLICRARM